MRVLDRNAALSGGQAEARRECVEVNGLPQSKQRRYDKAAMEKARCDRPASPTDSSRYLSEFLFRWVFGSGLRLVSGLSRGYDRESSGKSHLREYVRDSLDRHPYLENFI